LEGLLNWLRGEQRSIKARFFRTPIERLELALARLKGQTYTEWYAQRMNRQARNATNNGRPVRQWYLDDAERQFEYAKRSGVLPTHNFLEFGCGIMRFGMYLAKYLEPGNYLGADISENRIKKGLGIAEEQGIPLEQLRYAVLTTAEAKELGEERFDVIWSYDVFPHMPIDEFERCLIHLTERLQPGGRIFMTFSRRDAPYSLNAKDYWFTWEQVQGVATRNGYSAEIQEDWSTDFRLDVQADQTMVLLSRD
jgi:cyclopropane fatty-acyl-phospholipid synthase-like methyltransferase